MGLGQKFGSRVASGKACGLNVQAKTLLGPGSTSVTACLADGLERKGVGVWAEVRVGAWSRAEVGVGAWSRAEALLGTRVNHLLNMLIA